MARKPNYDFEKRRKEQERKAKQDQKQIAKDAAKAERKRLIAAGEDPDLVAMQAEIDAGLEIEGGTDEAQADGADEAGTDDARAGETAR